MSDNHEHHLMSLGTHWKVFGALIALTVLTVAFAQIDLGILNPIIAFVLATTKAVIVMSWFMHLKYDSVLNRVIFGSSFFFLAVLLVFSLLDIFTRINPRA